MSANGNATGSITRQTDDTYLLQGVLSFDSAAALARQGNELFKSAGATVSVDLSGVDRSDSAGLALLLEWMRAARKRNQTLVFSHVPRQIQDIAAVSGVKSLLNAESI
ncbi:MAG: STAS domain-containing protein [Gammaproteobacteria bacterium]|nr:STAS domain-containing protein [Gammaproteobacteria bacterium]MDH5799866.1 STAS domain-containing protein [Gammaproteobacteria bacterium]